MDPPIPDFIATEARFGARNYEPLGVILSRGEGVWVWDTQGNRYLDCLSAYSAVNQGHCHPKILAAMVEQAGKLRPLAPSTTTNLPRFTSRSRSLPAPTRCCQ